MRAWRLVGGLEADRAGQNAAFDERLEPVADPEHRLAAFDELAHLVGEVDVHLERHQLAAAERVGVGEAARDDQDLVILPLHAAFAQLVEVDRIRLGAGFFKRGGGFDIAVDAVGMQDQGLGFHG